MKKIIAVVGAVLMLGGTFAAAAPAAAFSGKKMMKGQLVDATKKEMTVTFAGSKIFVPAGQTVILSQRENGSLVIRGNNLNNVTVDGTALSTQGYTVLSYQPASHVVFLNKGQSLTVTDPKGVPATVAEGGAVSTTNAAINSNTVEELKAQAQVEAQQAAAELGDILELPAFVAQTTPSEEAIGQAVEDVEETVSPSAPR